MLDELEEAVCELLLQVEADIDKAKGNECGVSAYVWYRPAMSFPWTLGIEHDETPVCHINGKDAAGVYDTWHRCGLTDVQRIVNEQSANREIGL